MNVIIFRNDIKYNSIFQASLNQSRILEIYRRLNFYFDKIRSVAISIQLRQMTAFQIGTVFVIKKIIDLSKWKIFLRLEFSHFVFI